ncbi:MAG: hypothetical protein SPI12_04960 [Actinomycetaceae bacterium]|nr:hypothetical protein [Actinomycetaceae bacterium]MDY6083195.1 hypothetical protein [Actinomycetaceae bacterium]
MADDNPQVFPPSVPEPPHMPGGMQNTGAASENQNSAPQHQSTPAQPEGAAVPPQMPGGSHTEQPQWPNSGYAQQPAAQYTGAQYQQYAAQTGPIPQAGSIPQTYGSGYPAQPAQPSPFVLHLKNMWGVVSDTWHNRVTTAIGRAQRIPWYMTLIPIFLVSLFEMLCSGRFIAENIKVVVNAVVDVIPFAGTMLRHQAFAAPYFAFSASEFFLGVLLVFIFNTGLFFLWSAFVQATFRTRKVPVSFTQAASISGFEWVYGSLITAAAFVLMLIPGGALMTIVIFVAASIGMGVTILSYFMTYFSITKAAPSSSSYARPYILFVILRQLIALFVVALYFYIRFQGMIDSVTNVTSLM